MAVDATKTRPRLSWKRGTIHVRTSISALLLEIDGAPPSHAPVDTKALEQALAVQLVGRIARLVQWTQQHQVDVLGIDTGVDARHPVWFQDHADEWPTLYAHAPVTVSRPRYTPRYRKLEGTVTSAHAMTMVRVPVARQG